MGGNRIRDLPLSEDECEDLELLSSPGFLVAMNKLVKAIEETDFDIKKVKQITSIMLISN